VGPRDGKPRATIPEKEKIGCLAWSPDGTVLAAGEFSPFDTTNVVLHDAAGQVTGELALHKSYIHGVAFTPDGKGLVSGSHDKLVALWDVPGKKLVDKLELPDSVDDVAVSPDGKLAAVGAGRKVHFLSLGATLARGKTLDVGFNVNAVSFSKDGKKLAVGSVRTDVFEVESGKELGLHACGSNTTGAVWSPDGTTIACWLKTVYVFDAATFKTTKSFEGHRAGVLAGAFSPDGKLLATASRDTTVLIWEVR
jgi:WD40 repeat protein